MMSIRYEVCFYCKGIVPNCKCQVNVNLGMKLRTLTDLVNHNRNDKLWALPREARTAAILAEQAERDSRPSTQFTCAEDDVAWAIKVKLGLITAEQDAHLKACREREDAVGVA